MLVVPVYCQSASGCRPEHAPAVTVNVGVTSSPDTRTLQAPAGAGAAPRRVQTIVAAVMFFVMYTPLSVTTT